MEIRRKKEGTRDRMRGAVLKEEEHEEEGEGGTTRGNKRKEKAGKKW